MGKMIFCAIRACKTERITLTMQSDTPTEVSKSHVRLWLRLLGLSRTVEATLRELFREEFQSTLPRFDVMAALDRHPDGLKMSELSQVLRVSNGNITGLIDRLVEDGFAQRSPVPGDRRAHRVSLTAPGKAQFAQMAQKHEVWISEIFETFDAEEASSLSDRLRSVTDSLEK